MTAYTGPERRKTIVGSDWQARVEADLAAMKSDLAANTQATQVLAVKVTALETATKPVTDAMASMQTGIEVIGKFGSFVGKWGGRIAKALVWVLALWGAAKVLTGGGSWSDAVEMFWKLVGVTR